MIHSVFHRDIHRPKRSIRFYKYLLSYIFLVVTTLLLIGGIVYGSFIGALQHEVESFNFSVLKQAADVMDMRFKEMEAIALQAAANPRLTPFVVTNNEYESFQAVRELNNYRASNSFIYDVALYYNIRNNDMIYAASGTYRSDIFFNRTYQYEHWGKENFLNSLPNMSAAVIRSMEPVRLNGLYPSNFVTYLYPLPVGWGNPYGAVIYLIEYKAFNTVIENALGNYNGHFFIMDDRKQPIVTISAGETESTPEMVVSALDMAQSSQGVNTVPVGKEKYSVLTKKSDYNGLTYIMAMPTSQFFSKVYRSQRLFYYAVAVVILMGTLLGFIFSNRNYLPLRRLVDILRGIETAPDSLGKQDEIAYISTTVSEIIRENRGLATQLKSKASMVKEQLLLDLIRGKSKESEEREKMLETSNIKLRGPGFVVLLFSIDDYDDFQKNNSGSKQELFKFSMTNILEEISQEVGNGYAVDLPDDRGIALIVSLNDGSSDRQHIEAMARKAREILKQYFEFTCTIGIGNIHEDMPEIHTSCVEAGRAVFYRLLKGKDRIIFYEEIIREQQSLYKYPAALEEQLVLAIRQGNESKVQTLIEEIIGDIRKQPLRPEIVQCICFGILNAILKTLNELEADTDTAFQEDVEYILLMRYDSMEVLANRMIRLGQKVCKRMVHLKEYKNVERREQITRYVHDNFCRSGLSLDEIAAWFHLSPSYITTFFKEQTGYSLMSYIDRLRMKKAKELLKTTNLTQREIMEQVGYIDQTNFIRKFKSTEGITPAVYRQMSRVGADQPKGN